MVIIPVVPNRKWDSWGNFRLEPIQVIEEHHRENAIKILIYQNDERFFYGYQVKLGTMIKQKSANIQDPGYKTSDIAGIYAKTEIRAVCNAHKHTKKIFEDFIQIRYNQGELF